MKSQPEGGDLVGIPLPSPLSARVQLQAFNHKEMEEASLDMYRFLFYNSYGGSLLIQGRALGSQPTYVSYIKYSVTNQNIEELETAFE